jgi:hypothetical protein
VTVPESLNLPTGSVTLASGAPVEVRKEAGRLVVIFDLEVADVLIFRSK